VVVNGRGDVVEAVTLPNGAQVPGDHPWMRLQDADRIFDGALALARALMARHGPIGAIGLDGQMHGILYVDAGGRALGPLATWQDGRGDRPFEGGTYASELSRATGHPMATGFGLTTHFWNVKNGVVPAGARWLLTIADYVALRLSGQKAPVMHTSCAASLGLFDVAAGAWDAPAVAAAGIDPGILPPVCAEARKIGAFDGAAVAVALGDNQASFIGSVRESSGAVLVNMGTGGQISMMSGAPGALDNVERRPLGKGSALLVGSVLCGGYAYALLEGFMRSCAALSGGDPGNLYAAMNAAAMDALSFSDLPGVLPRFSGTRRDPAARGAITGLSLSNFDAPRLIAGTLKGMAQDVFLLYQEMLDAGAQKADLLVGSGNAIRKNPALCRAFEMRFGLPLRIPAHQEEAAYGAALFGMAASGLAPSVESAQLLIRYQDP
jgi:sedoheptulokinase